MQTLFANLKVGEVFKICIDDCYMKTSNASPEVNAVNLKTGETLLLSSDILVDRVGWVMINGRGSGNENILTCDI